MGLMRLNSGGKRGMFPLVLNGVEVRTLEELRGNFDLEGVADYFHSGELLTWLENRFYDDEADAIANIDADDKNLTAKICAALDVECDTDLDFTRRLREKKALLAEMTDDENIIGNAAATALNQEDLATLIQMDYKTIYLCGENFNVPIRVAGVRYVGVLSTPKIKIRAKSQDDLDAQGIAFENVQLPWQKSLPIDELKALAEKIFQTGGKWPIVKSKVSLKRDAGNNIASFDELDKMEKAAALRMVCQGKYTEQQIAFMQLTDDLSSGFAMTVDSFCTGGGVGARIIPYKKIKIASRYKARSYSTVNGLSVDFSGGTLYLNSENDHYKPVYNASACKKLFSASDYEKIKNFLEVAKNF